MSSWGERPTICSMASSAVFGLLFSRQAADRCWLLSALSEFAIVLRWFLASWVGSRTKGIRWGPSVLEGWFHAELGFWWMQTQCLSQGSCCSCGKATWTSEYRSSSWQQAKRWQIVSPCWKVGACTWSLGYQGSREAKSQSCLKSVVPSRQLCPPCATHASPPSWLEPNLQSPHQWKKRCAPATYSLVLWWQL